MSDLHSPSTSFTSMETPSHIPSAPSPTPNVSVPPPARRGMSWKSIILISLGVFVLGCGITAGAAVWWVKSNFYAKPIQPVTLTAKEQQTMEAKLHVLEASASPTSQPEVSPGEQERTLMVSAKEINAYLATQNLGDTVQVNLGSDNISATMLIPVPQDAGIPLISGTTLKVSLSLDAHMNAEKKAVIAIKDVRVGGMPMPNSWLGGIKGMNLTGEGLNEEPGVKRILSGIQSIKITPEGLRLVLAE